MRRFGIAALVVATTVGCTSSAHPNAETATTAVEPTTTEVASTTADPRPPKPTTTTVSDVSDASDASDVADASDASDASDVFGNGTYVVGTDIRPGMYRVFGYWARLDDALEIIDNDGVYENGVGLMKVFPTDSFVEINGGAHPLSASGTLNPVADGFTTGTYLVNWDIQPGRYRISAIDGSTYYARLDAAGNIVGEDATDGDTIVIVDAHDWALTFDGVITPA